MPARTDWPSTSTPLRGKGSHGTVYVGLRQTRVQHGEIRKGTLAAMLKQLEIPREEF